jgi:acetyltransferase (GNAT) family protein
MATLTPQEINRLVELAELNTCTELWSILPLEVVSQLGLHLEKVGSATALIMSKVDIGEFNRVIGVGIGEPATESIIDRIIALYSSSGNTFVVHVDPAAQPAELTIWLEQRGFERGPNSVWLYRDTSPPPDITTDLRIECIGPKNAGAFADVGLAAFEMPAELRPWAASLVGRPNWRNYLAFDGEEPVASASLFVQDGIGWLGNGATLPSHRRRGAQGALMAQRIRDGIEMQCEWFVTETGEETVDDPNPSYHNMLRTGFKPGYIRANYALAKTVSV